jgi:hypothetical protein
MIRAMAEVAPAIADRLATSSRARPISPTSFATSCLPRLRAPDGRATYTMPRLTHAILLVDPSARAGIATRKIIGAKRRACGC